VRQSLRWFGVLALLLLPVLPSSARQDHPLCTTTASGPFTVTSGAPFTVSWIMADTAVENGINVPNRYEGFYLQVDGGPKSDIGLATALPACSGTSARPNDVPFTYRTTAGVARGSHQLKLSAWSHVLDGAGNPTTTIQESVVSTVPFSAGDALLFGPPMQPTNILITGQQSAPQITPTGRGRGRGDK
jgi:hypothetical protein